jgi:hypothetical protein
VKGGLLLNVVVAEGAAVLELLSGEDQTLLVRGNSLLVLDLGLNALDGVRALDFKGDGLSSEGLNENLHSSTETEHQVKGGFLLDVVVGKGPSVFELLASEDQTLLVGGDSFLVLDLGLNALDCVGALDFQGNGLASEGLDEDLEYL